MFLNQGIQPMKTLFQTLILLSFLFLLAACQGSPTPKPVPTSLPPANTPAPAALSTQPAVTEAPTPTQTALPSAAPTLDPAEQAIQEYAAALQAGDFRAAAALLSNFSLMVDEMTRSAASDELQLRMAREKWSGFQVKETRPFNEKTILVHVTYQVETKDPKTGQSSQAAVDELWPVRLEYGKWLYNRGNVIDYHTLDVLEHTTAGLTVKPRRLTRYSDRMRLTLLVQNQTNDPIVLGQTNEVMAAFLFGDQKVEAEKTQLIFDTLRSYPDTAIEVKGLFANYPDGVVIRQWKNIQVAPWFTFQFSQ
jgi:hypothetical protein